MHQADNLPYNDCIFCGEEQGTGMAVMMGQALMAKHATNQSDNLIAYVDVIMKLEEPCNSFQAWAAFQYKEGQVQDQEEEFLKREYGASQFDSKINMLTEYYKFHSDLPRVVEPKIEKILGKYYDKKRELDYKKVKRILKEEQGLSISSVQESESSINGDSMVEKRSRYSTLLDALEETKGHDQNHMSDSKLLKDMCKVIEKALPSTKHDHRFDIKGSFNHDKYFEDFIKKQEGRFKPKLNNRYKETDQNKIRRLNLQQLLRRKNRKSFEKSRERDTNIRDSRQGRRKDKDKPVYNTNIKIEIKNAMFYSHGQGQSQAPPFNVLDMKYDTNNKPDPNFRKKSLINQVNYLNQQSNKKLVAEIYKSSQHDLKKRLQQNSSSKQRVTTKESMNRSQSKTRKNSLSKPSLKDVRKGLTGGTSGSISARKLVYPNNDWAVTNNQGNTSNNMGSNGKGPSRSTSASNLKKRSFSTNAMHQGGGATIAVSSIPRRNDKVIERRPVETISKYGSSDINSRSGSAAADRQKRAVSIKELLNRKLTVKRES